MDDQVRPESPLESLHVSYAPQERSSGETEYGRRFGIITAGRANIALVFWAPEGVRKELQWASVCRILSDVFAELIRVAPWICADEQGTIELDFSGSPYRTGCGLEYRRVTLSASVGFSKRENDSTIPMHVTYDDFVTTADDCGSIRIDWNDAVSDAIGLAILAWIDRYQRTLESAITPRPVIFENNSSAQIVAAA